MQILSKARVHAHTHTHVHIRAHILHTERGGGVISEPLFCSLAKQAPVNTNVAFWSFIIIFF